MTGSTRTATPGGRGKRWASLALAGLLAAAGLAAIGTPAARAAAETHYAVNGSFAFTGHGTGHGRGLSQYGAYGAATQGLTAAQILDFYYPGTTSAAAGNPIVRVRLSGDDGADLPVSPQPRDGTLQVVDHGNANRALTLPATVNGAAVTGWRAHANGDGTVALQGLWSGAWQAYPAAVVPTAPAAPTTPTGPTSPTAPTAPWVTSGVLEFSGAAGQLTYIRADGTLRDYAGTLASVASGAGLVTVNLVAMDSYVRSVVPSESPASWPAAALQAQAVAARSYTLAVSRATAAYDICDTTACQVYSGLTAYAADGTLLRNYVAPSTDAAVSATSGLIRTYGGVPIFAQYSASNGGYTVADATRPYLVAKPDPYDGVSNSTAHSWSQSIDAASLGTAFGIGLVSLLTVNSRDGHGDWGGRTLSVTVTGATGSVTVSGEAFRATAGLRSSWWTLPAGDALSSGGGAATGDLFALALNNTGSGQVEVHELTAASGYSQFALHSATGEPAVTAADWRLFVAPFGHDGQHDLWAVHLRGTTSGYVEIDVLSAVSGYTASLEHAVTALPALAPGGADLALGSYAGDGGEDLFYVPWQHTGSGTVEVHVLSDASHYQSFVAHLPTALATTGVRPGEWRFLVGDSAGRGDLVAIHGSGTTGSKRTEVHVLGEASAYQTWTLHAATPLALQPAGDVTFRLGSANGDAATDLFVLLRGAHTGSGRTEVHVLSGATGYGTYLSHAATALPPLSAAQWQFAIG